MSEQQVPDSNELSVGNQTDHLDQIVEQEQVPQKFKFTWCHAAGFFGWFIINGLLWYLAGDTYGVLNLFLFPANLILLIVLFAIKSTRTIAQGILIAWALNFVFSLFMSSFFNGACLVPFFVNFW